MKEESNTLNILFAVAIGLVMGGHIADRTYLPQLRDEGTDRAEHLKYIRLLERERGGLQQSITILKAREALISEATLKDLGLDKHYRVVKNNKKEASTP